MVCVPPDPSHSSPWFLFMKVRECIMVGFDVSATGFVSMVRTLV